ncbi:hypothetical protein AYJ08_05040 [Brevibacillus sp. SKDU10]|uniref:hypothetical protein n=1 Tax=Brevibacillus sp. SKDU10 TaxID=1247872 RepID=UPI0007C8DE4F|nr:hypothetical protein [Brevibacillus sp. SKDU10]OAJ75258.1 hypothetical protein AYJ08_05040 [Brevibacillus sp. SKDU10]
MDEKVNDIETPEDNGHPYPPDQPTIFNHLWARFVYILIAWVILGMGINEGFFTSLTLFYVPLFLDYLKFDRKTYIRKWVKVCGIFTSAFWAIMGFVGTSGILKVVTEDGRLMGMVSEKYIIFSGASFPLIIIWCCIAFNVLLAAIDPFIYESTSEKKVIMKMEVPQRVEG